MHYPDINWNGKSGRTYAYQIFPFDFNFHSNQVGNFIFAKKTSNGWDAVYIGEGHLKSRIEAHIKNGYVKQKGSTHIHVHLNISDDERKQEESDLLKYNTEAYEPSGCNITLPTNF